MTPLSLESPAFAPGASIPRLHTCDGRDVSPLLRWEHAPAGTMTWALVCDDPDAPGKTWIHWVLFDLPASVLELPEGVPASAELPTGARQGKNDFGKLGYGGPCPPKGKAHRYYFRLYALERKLGLPSGATRDQVAQAMEGHVLARGELMGLYARS